MRFATPVVSHCAKDQNEGFGGMQVRVLSVAEVAARGSDFFSFVCVDTSLLHVQFVASL